MNMNSIEAQQHIEEARRMLDKADKTDIDGNQSVATCIGALIIAIEQLTVIVEDLANREQGKMINIAPKWLNQSLNEDAGVYRP
jgi:hypothetical protein